MKAITDFAATKAHILYAVQVFKDGFTDMCEQEELARQEWAKKKAAKDWFRRSLDYWNQVSRGEIGDSFERYQYTYMFRPENYVWFEARLQDATYLLQKFDCAVDDCEATTLYLSDKDLTLLSVSLQSAERN